MGFLRRRWPLYVSPAPALLGTLLAATCLSWAFTWDWNWSLQTGNVFLLLLVPDTIVRVGPLHLLALVVAAGGIALAIWGMHRSPQDAPTGSWVRPRARFFPLTALFGLFLLAFATVFLFDPSVYGDMAPGGYAVFVYLDYAGLFDRPVSTTIGALLLAAGAAFTTTLAFEWGLGEARHEPAPTHRAAPPTAPAPPPVIPTIMPRSSRSVLPIARAAASDRPAASPHRAAHAAEARRPEGLSAREP